jgi:outer membrane lipoprotein carrier protein
MMTSWPLLGQTKLTAEQQKQIIEKIDQTASAMTGMQCDFVQTKHLRLLKDDMVSKGKMYYQQSNHLRWEYTTPYSYTFIINNDKVFIKSKQRNDIIDVNQNKLFKEIARIMMNSVVGNCLNDEKSFRSTISVGSDEWIATLLPLRKDIKQMFQKIVLYINPKQAIVTKMELMEKNGDMTVIDLKNVRINETINNNMFSIR